MNSYFFLSKLLTPIILPYNFLVIFLVIFFLLNKKKFFKIFFLILIIISIFPVGQIFTNYFLNKDFINRENYKNFDSILILGGNINRILYATSLHRLNPEAKIIFSGGTGLIYPNHDQLHNNEVKQFNYYINGLIKKDKIFILSQSRNTYENLENFKNKRKELNLKKTVVISDIWHYKRIFAIARQLDLDLDPFYKAKFDDNLSLIQKYQLLDFSNNIKFFNIFFKEICGIIAIKFFNL